jgi:uncharacterized damage-inducible protein DinB
MKKNVFQDQWAVCYDQSNWFVSLRNALDGLTTEQASWKAGEQTNSIWEIVNHLIYWNERYYDRFQGVAAWETSSENDNTFAPIDGWNWQETVEKCYLILSKWIDAMENSEEDKLDALANENLDYAWSSVLSNLTLHNAYHIGQIVYIRKQQLSWDSAKGVKG